MTLDDLLTQPRPRPQYARADFLKPEMVPDLDLVRNGSKLTSQESYCLMSHLLYENHYQLLPLAWRERVAEAVLYVIGKHPAQFGRPGVTADAIQFAGSQTIEQLKTLVRGERIPLNFSFFVLQGLLERDWLEGIALVAELGLYQQRGPYLSYIQKQIEKIREREGVAQEVWDLVLASPDSTRTDKKRRASMSPLHAFMQGGVQFTARDFRLLAEHSIYGKDIRGLVLTVYSKRGSREDLWPCELVDDDAVSITHPATVDEEQREAWKARLAREGRVAPFEQWSGGGRSRSIEITGITLPPSDLMLRLESRGWQRGRRDAAGVIRWHMKHFSDLKLLAIVEYPGIPTAFGGRWTPQSIERVRFESETSGEELDRASVSPIALTVVAGDLEELRR
jgi:Domain of unknown function (DUF4132)